MLCYFRLFVNFSSYSVNLKMRNVENKQGAGIVKEKAGLKESEEGRGIM